MMMDMESAPAFQMMFFTLFWKANGIFARLMQAVAPEAGTSRSKHETGDLETDSTCTVLCGLSKGEEARKSTRQAITSPP
jgi:hypothetical protein